MRFQPLTRDYWPARVRHPMARLALAAALTPPFAALCAGFAMWLVYNFAPYPPPWPFQAPLPFFFELALEIYFFAIFAVAPIFLLLWSLRIRTLSAFIFGGALGGLLGAGVTSLRFGEMNVTQLMIAIALGVFLSVLLRIFAGVRIIIRTTL